ncbi:MAG: DNA mismatch repair protein MutS [Phycisphaerales bacterium]|nr:DNA mismatch repair protein MutS [Phycisphaerales bacterium]
MATDPRDTPAMRQYYRFKRAHPDCVLLFRIGDFYEMFDDDAVNVSKAIGLTLTQRTEGVPMAGVPFHQLENYLRKLIDKGFRVAVAEQVQDPSEAKGVIDRAVDRVLTPGTLVDDSLLSPDSSRTLAAVCFLDSGDAPSARVAAAITDLSTGRFLTLESTAATVGDELARHQVGELLFAATAVGDTPPRIATILTALGVSGSPQPAWHFRQDEAAEAIRAQFGVSTMAGFGFADDDPLLRSAGAIVRYLVSTQLAASAGSTTGQSTPEGRARSLAHLQPPRRDDATGLCRLDATSLRSLEVLATIRPPTPDSPDASLCGVFGASRTFPGCRTPMGRRLLREWLCAPLCDIGGIEARQHAVSTLLEDRRAASQLTDELAQVQDIARIAARLALGRAGPRDLLALGRSLAHIRGVSEALTNARAFARHLNTIDPLAVALSTLAGAITTACVDSPPNHLRDGGLIRDGFDAALDEARTLQRDAAGFMAEYQKRLIDQHELPSLKVGYNSVFGYYIELPAAQARRAPTDFTRKQTLKSAERYITPELKEFESKIRHAEARALEREHAIFDELCRRASALIGSITTFADVCAELDVLACFAEKAHRRRWVRPEITDAPVLRIHQGRHPVLDELLESRFVPNDLELGGDDSPSPAQATLALITGPNMAGKSTYIRTAALLSLLAHTGSFIPADRAVVGLTDRIFTRIGADDALHAGQSTFMVEMTETARILNHATPRSLIILDEIGRGTSTLDGLSLAWAIAETLASAAEADRPGPRTLFATHYHELTDLEERLAGRVINLHVAVREFNDEIVFLHRILPGRTDQSYGIHVAKLAGLPARTIGRAREVLGSLAVHHHPLGEEPSDGSTPSANGRRSRSHDTGGIASHPRSGQMSLFTEFVPHPAVDQLREIKIDGLSPLQAFDALRQLKSLTEH